MLFYNKASEEKYFDNNIGMDFVGWWGGNK